MNWFRSWHGAPTDTKWLVIARKAEVAAGIVSAIAWALMDYASQHADRGSVDGFDTETYSAFSGIADGEVIAVIAAMRAKNVIDGANRLTNWDKRQPKREDDSTGRVKAFRQRDRDTVTQCNAEKRTVTHGNNTEKIQSREDTEQNREDTEKARERAAAPPQSSLPAQVQVFIDNGGKWPTGKLTDGTTRKDAAIAYICQWVKDNPASLALWGRVVAGYCKQWSPKSYTVMVQEYYLNNRIPGEQRNGNGAGGREHPGITALRMVQEEERGNQHQ